MIRKLTLFLALILSLLAICAPALAGAYEPFDATKQQFSEAFAGGKLVKGDLRIQFSGDVSAMGLDADDARTFNALTKILPETAFSFGAGKLDNGLRLEFGGSYGLSDAVAVDAALNITHDGLLIESSLIEGEAFSISWETLLRLCELPEEQIQMILMARDTDYQALAAQMISVVQTYMPLAMQLLTPYAETIGTFVASLPVSIQENVPGEGFYPAAAQEITISITAKDIGRLVALLAEQLENDATLSTLLNMALAQQSEIPVSSTQELCAIVKEAAAQITDTAHPLALLLGTDDAGNPLYLQAAWADNTETTYVAEIIHSESEVPNAGVVRLHLYSALDGSALDDGMTLTVHYADDPADANIYDYSAVLGLHTDGIAFLTAEFTSASKASGSEELLAYGGRHTFSMSAAENAGDFSIILGFDTIAEQLAGGGEHLMAAGSIDMYVEGSSLPVSFSNELVFTPSASGPEATYTESGSLPAYGVTSFAENYTFYTQDYDPAKTAALHLTQFEAASNEDLQAFANRLLTSAQSFAEALKTKLPPEVVQLIAESI